MADLSDVEIAIVDEATSGFYPDGIDNNSLLGVTCRVYRGWPSPATLNADLAAGVVNVTVFPTTDPHERIPSFFNDSLVNRTAAGMSAIVSNSDVTLAGTAVPRQVVGLLLDGVPFLYRVVLNDSLSTVAANLAAVIRQSRMVLVSGATLTVPGATSVSARVIAPASVSIGIRRQRKDIQISFWCPSPSLRDVAAKSLDTRLAAQSFIALADDSKAHLHYRSTQVYDQSQNALLYRRDLVYRCEYSTTIIDNAPVMVFGELFRGGASTYV